MCLCIHNLLPSPQLKGSQRIKKLYSKFKRIHPTGQGHSSTPPPLMRGIHTALRPFDATPVTGKASIELTSY